LRRQRGSASKGDRGRAKGESFAELKALRADEFPAGTAGLTDETQRRLKAAIAQALSEFEA
jgi:hypothetical protein